MKVLFKKDGKYENLIVVPDGIHYSITVEGENDDKQLVFGVGGERFVLESTKDICQKSRGANPQLAIDIFNEIIFHLSRHPVPVDMWDISSTQSRVLAKYEEAWQELEHLLDPKTEESVSEQTQNKNVKAPFIFSKILAYLEEKQGSAVGEWFRDADVKLSEEGALVILIKSAFCREVLQRRSLAEMKKYVTEELGLDIDVIITAPAE